LVLLGKRTREIRELRTRRISPAAQRRPWLPFVVSSSAIATPWTRYLLHRRDRVRRCKHRLTRDRLQLRTSVSRVSTTSTDGNVNKNDRMSRGQVMARNPTGQGSLAGLAQPASAKRPRFWRAQPQRWPCPTLHRILQRRPSITLNSPCFRGVFRSCPIGGAVACPPFVPPRDGGRYFGRRVNPQKWHARSWRIILDSDRAANRRVSDLTISLR
jgi:hypothetical protein